jgi:hypothetical protein
MLIFTVNKSKKPVIMETLKETVKSFFGRKPEGPKIRYGIISAGWITQSAFMPGVGQTSNSG